MKPKISEFNNLLEPKWYTQEFNATPALLDMGGWSGIHSCKKNLGYHYTHFIETYENDFVAGYYDRKELHYMAYEFMKRYRKDRKYLHRIIEINMREVKPMHNYIKNRIGKIEKLSTPKLVSEYRKFAEYTHGAFGIGHLIESLSLTTDVMMKDMLLKALAKKELKNKFTEYFTVLTQPIRRFFLTDYNHSLNRLVALIRKDKKLLEVFTKSNLKNIEKNLAGKKGVNKAVENHLKRFFWIRSNFKEGTKLSKNDVMTELKNVVTGKDRLEVTPLKQFGENLEKKNELIRKLRLPKKLVDLIRITDVVTYWQDDRKANIITGCLGIDMFLKEIGKRSNISHANMRYIMLHETTLENLKKFDNKKLAKRRKSCIVFYDFNKEQFVEIYEGRECDEYKRKLIKHEDGKEHKELSGICASMGKVIANVMICKTIKELSRFEKGRVLVTSMTRPEFVPAMKKAAAIVTDEGGLTCHAAVISRELGVPCVIGTKVATKVLKNGDLVEVNANHALVNVIKKG